MLTENRRVARRFALIWGVTPVCAKMPAGLDEVFLQAGQEARKRGLLSPGGLAIVTAGFPIFGWIGARHQDARLSRDRPGYATLVACTSIVPFAAIAARRQRLGARDLPPLAVVVGLLLFVVLRAWHDELFGR